MHAETDLARVEHSALRLLAGLPTAPARLKVSAGEYTVELEWPAVAAAPGPTATQAVPSPEPAPAQVADEHDYICAPTVGVFYAAASPGTEPFVAEGQAVAAGQQVGIVEAMKLMIPITAEAPGTVAAVLKANGDAVEYGERLIALTPDRP